MVHRRLLEDDGRGVDEALNETVGGMSHYPEWRRSGKGITVSGKHVVLLSSKQHALRELRLAAQQIYFAPVTFVGRKPALPDPGRGTLASPPAQSPVIPVLDVTALEIPMVEIVSLLKWDKESDAYLLRLGHTFAISEDDDYSKSVDVDLSKLLKPLGVSMIEERSLTANQNKADMVSKRLLWDVDGDGDGDGGIVDVQNNVKEMVVEGKVVLQEDSLIITLRPMQIRTFLLSRAASL